MSIAQKSLAFIAVAAVAVAVVFSFVTTLKVASAATVNGCPHTWSVNLKVGSKGPDVMALQQLLNSDSATVVAASGAGSPGMETSYFGGLTMKAVVKFQEKYSAKVLLPLGLSKGTGYFGASSRGQANGICAGTVVPTPTPTPTPSAGTGLAVAAGTQPASSLAPKGASRVPFTTFNLTAGNDGDVTVTSVTVQRTGLGSDAAFNGVILVDQDTGMQVGTSKTFNSNHQANIGASILIPKGTTKHFLVAGNMQADLSAYAGQAPSIAVVAINTTANVSGSLPITGASQTLNNTLTVGTLTLDASNAYAVNAGSNQNIGATNYRFTGFRLTAGSAEDVRLRSITWNQTGSVSSSDLANVVTVVNGTSYPTVVSADGKYYYSNLGAGVVIPKGNSVDVYVQGDIVGSNASGRSIIFDVDKNTDVFATGETYGYGISPVAPGTAVPTTRGNLVVTGGSPYIYAAQINVTGASVTTIAKANEVPSQNIAVNVSNQPLGGFAVDFKGEAVTVQSLKFAVASSTGAGLLTNVTLVDSNGSVVAGPVDAVGGNITFTDTVTFQPGRHVYTIRGKVPSGTATGVTYQLSTDPSTGWTNVKGANSGNTISLAGQTSFTMNTMTVRAGSIAVGVASSPASQTIVPGGSQVLMANFQFDASQSGEDIRFSSVPVTLTFGGLAAKSDLSSCQLYDGTTALNSGSNVFQPSNAVSTTSPYSATIVLDNPVVVTKGTVKTLGLRCNVSGSALNGSTYSFAPGSIGSFTFTGANSGTTVTGTAASSPTITTTIGVGAATVTTDASSPGYTLAAAGQTDVPVVSMKLHATNEAVNVTKIGLQLTGSTVAADLVKASIYDGATKVGEAFFTGTNLVATSSLTGAVTIPANGDKTLTVKVDLAQIGTGQSVTVSGHVITVNFLNAEGVGASSGNTVFVTGSTAASGVEVLKSYPMVSLDTLPSTGVSDGRLMRFKVTANQAGPVGLTNFGLNIATSTAVVTNVTIYAFTDANYSQPISGVTGSGDLQCADDATVPANGNVQVAVTDNACTAKAIQVAAGSTTYFEVRASVSGVTSGSSVTTKLLGASSAALPLAQASTLGALDFVWSPNSTTTSSRTDADWTNGFAVPGLPSGGLIQTRSN